MKKLGFITVLFLLVTSNSYSIIKDDQLAISTRVESVETSITSGGTLNSEISGKINKQGSYNLLSTGTLEVKSFGGTHSLFKVGNEALTVTIKNLDLTGNILSTLPSAGTFEIKDSGAVSVFKVDNDTQMVTAKKLTVNGDIVVTGNVDGVDVSALNTTVTGKMDKTGTTLTTGGSFEIKSFDSTTLIKGDDTGKL
jgi:hypothetical protein